MVTLRTSTELSVATSKNH